MKYVLQVFYEKNSSDDFPEIDGKEHNGLKLWRPNKTPVMHWAIDYVSCSDARWVVYGPFGTLKATRSALSKLEGYLGQYMPIRGYRIINEHCFDALVRREYDYIFYTDG